MKNSKLIKWGGVHAFGVLIYVFLLSTFMNQANSWFGAEDQDVVTPVAVLMLFIFSALITGGLVLGKPVMLYLDGKKKEGIKLLFFTGVSLFIFMVLTFLLLLIIK